MLVRRDALARAGGMASIRAALIDDCALAKRLKAHGPIWIGLTDGVRSVRTLPRTRRHPPHGLAHGVCAASLFAAAACGNRVGPGDHLFGPVLLTVLPAAPAASSALRRGFLMALAFQPILRFYRVSPLWGLALPAIAAIYMASR